MNLKKLFTTAGLAMACMATFAQNPGWIVAGKQVTFQGTSVSMANLPSPAFAYGTNSPNTANYPWDGYDANAYGDYTANMIRNVQGDIIFFIQDGVLFDGTGNYIDDFNNYYSTMKGAAETAIVPDPGDCNRFYIFTHQIMNFDRFPYVFLLDMSGANIYASGPNACEYKGELIPIGSNGNMALSLKGITPAWAPTSTIGQITMAEDKNSLGMIAVSDLRADNTRIAFVTNKQGAFRYKISASGVAYDNYMIPFPYRAFNQASKRSVMEMVEIDGGYRVAVAYQSEGYSIGNQNVSSFLLVADLDLNGNVISGSEKYFPAFFYLNQGDWEEAQFRGLEFSENGNRLYVTRRPTPIQPDQMLYYDFNNPTQDLLSFNISPSYDVRYSEMELAFNDRLVISYANGLLQLPNASTATAASISPLLSFSNPATYMGNPPASSESHKLYPLPDQIDGMDYEAFQVANLACCINSSTFEADYYVAGNGTWAPGSAANPFGSSSGTIYVKQEIRIPQNVNVTINNMTLRFAPGARLVVENGTGGAQGGKLTLNNTTLTVDERCSDESLWLGVEVWGNTADAQGSISSSTQGRLVMGSGSKIEHAWTGVLVGKRTATIVTNGTCTPTQTVNSFSFDGNFDGGIVQATGATFVNNQRGVWFKSYLPSSGANNASYFSRCDFEWNGPLRGGASIQVLADMYAVKGVRYIGCDFANLQPNLSNPGYNGTGILSNFSQFTVAEYCSQLLLPCQTCSAPTPSTFSNLRYGIRTYNPSDDLTFWVSKSDFIDCQYGIRGQYTKNGTITENDFLVLQNPSYQTAGIAMYSTPSFTIQENHIDGNGNPSTAQSYGMVMNNTGTVDNDIYKNWLSNLKIGVQSEGNNATQITATNYPGVSGFEMSGLNYTCNEFNSDIMTADMTVVSGRIDYFQGFPNGYSSLNAATLGAARNKFSQHAEGMTAEHDIKVSGSGVQSLMYVGLNTPNYFADSYTSNFVTSLIASYNGTYATASTSMCPSKICTKTRARLKSDWSDLKAELHALEMESSARMASKEEKAAMESQQLQLKNAIAAMEHQLIGQILIEVDNRAELQAELTEIGQEALWFSIASRLDSKIELPSSEFGEPETFLPLEKASGTMAASPITAEAIAFKASPNPSRGQFKIDLLDGADFDLQVQVMDLMGRQVFAGNLKAGMDKQIDLSQLQNGIYILMLKSEGRLSSSQKIEILR